jgi:hypothetical protein
MNPTLMKAIVDFAAFLSLSTDDVVNPDAAVAQLEQLAGTLSQLNADERRTFSNFVEGMKKSEKSSANQDRLEFLDSLVQNLGV